jgi:TolB-like protein
LTGGEEADRFAEGLTHELIHALTESKRFRVFAWEGPADGRRQDTREAGLGANANCALTGTVRSAKSGLRVSVELISAADQTVLWSTMCNADLDDATGSQERVAREVVEGLSATMVAAAGGEPKSRETQQLYRKARYTLAKFDRFGLLRSRDFLEQALRIESTRIRCVPAARFTGVVTGIAGCSDQLPPTSWLSTYSSPPRRSPA